MLILPLGVERQALHPPSNNLFSSDEDIGGGGIALQALLFTLWVCTRRCLIVLYEVFRLVSIKELAGIDMWCSDKKDTLTQCIMSKFPNVRLQSKGCCRLHYWLRCGPRTPRMSLPRIVQVQARSEGQFGPSHLIYSPFGVAIKTTRSIVAAWSHNPAEIKAGRVCASVLAF